MIKIKKKSSRNPDIEIKDLLLFWNIVQHGTFGRAGAAMGFSQPKVTRRVRLLEERFGTQLLFRNCRGVALTRNGEHVLEMARGIVERVEAMKAQANEDQSLMKGDISIVCTTGFNHFWLMNLMKSFWTIYPDVSFRVTTNDLGDGDLMLGEADISISSSLPGAREGMETRTLCTYPLHMYASPSYLAEKGMPSGFDDLDQHDLVVWSKQAESFAPPEHTAILLQASTSGKRAKRTPRLLVSNDNSLISATTNGAGLSLMPAFMGEHEKLTKIPFFDNQDLYRVRHKKYISWTRSVLKSARHQAFLEAIRKKAEQDPSMEDVWSERVF